MVMKAAAQTRAGAPTCIAQVLTHTFLNSTNKSHLHPKLCRIRRNRHHPRQRQQLPNHVVHHPSNDPPPPPLPLPLRHRHDHVNQVVQLFNKSKLFNCLQNIDIYNSLLSALCESKLFHAAYALIRCMLGKGLTPDKRTYALLVNAWCSAGKMREARQFLNEMSERGFTTPVRGRDLLIEGLLNAGYIESAKGMVKEGFVPDVGTFNALMESTAEKMNR